MLISFQAPGKSFRGCERAYTRMVEGLPVFPEKEALMFLLLMDYCAAAIPELATTRRYVAGFGWVLRRSL